MGAAPAFTARSREARLLGRVQHPERYREVLIPSGGAPIALSVWEPPSDAALVRGAVVFVPGTAVHPLFYEELLDGLCSAGWAVVGVHPEGHGKSPRVRRTLRLARAVDNVRDAVAWAHARGLGPLVLMGTSQGSLLALLAAADRPGVPHDAAVVGVLAHDVVEPHGADGVRITRFARLATLHRPIRAVISAASRVAPDLPVPIVAYLDPRRVFTTAGTTAQFMLDPLCLRSYPLRFLADLVDADTAALHDGRLHVPVTVVTASGDRLFPLEATRAAAAALRAPTVRVVVLEAACHLVLNEALDVAGPAVLDALQELVGAPEEGAS